MEFLPDDCPLRADIRRVRHRRSRTLLRGQLRIAPVSARVFHRPPFLSVKVEVWPVRQPVAHNIFRIIGDAADAARPFYARVVAERTREWLGRHKMVRWDAVLLRERDLMSHAFAERAARNDASAVDIDRTA